MLYIILGEDEYFDTIKTVIPDSNNLIMCRSFSSLVEELKTIKNFFLETDEKMCMIVHDETYSAPVGEALFLRERCGADTVIDWCCSPSWQLYIEEASNAPLLSQGSGFFVTEMEGYHLETDKNPFAAVLFGIDTEWNKDGKLYSIHSNKKTISISSIIKRAIIQYISESFGRCCTERDYDEIKESYGILFHRLSEELQTGISHESFYNDDIQWSDVFSTRKKLDIYRLLNQRLDRYETSIERKALSIKETAQNRFQKVVAFCQSNPKYGIMFAYSFFQEFLIPEVAQLIDGIIMEHSHFSIAEGQLKSDLEEAALLASRASRFGGGRDMAMEEYIDALETYRSCMVRQIILDALLDILKDMQSTAIMIAAHYNEAIRKRRSYIETNSSIHGEAGCDIFHMPIKEVKVAEEYIANDYFLELELYLKQKYEENIISSIKFRERNSSVQIIDDDIVWFDIEEVVLPDRMTESFRKEIKDDKERARIYERWIIEFMDNGILRKSGGEYEIISYEPIFKQEKKDLSLTDLLKLHRQFEMKQAESVVIKIPMKGNMSDLAGYLQEHASTFELIEQQSEIVYNNKMIRDWCRNELSMRFI